MLRVNTPDENLIAYLKEFESKEPSNKRFAIDKFLVRVDQFRKEGADLNSVTENNRNALAILCYMIENNARLYEDSFLRTDLAASLIAGVSTKPPNYARNLLHGLSFAYFSSGGFFEDFKWKKSVIDFIITLMKIDASVNPEPPGLAWWDGIQERAASADLLDIEHRLNVSYKSREVAVAWSKDKSKFLPELFVNIMKDEYYTKPKLEMIGMYLKQDLLNYINDDKAMDPIKKYGILKAVAKDIADAKYDPKRAKLPLSSVLLKQRSITAVDRSSPSIRLLNKLLLANKPDSDEEPSPLGPEPLPFCQRYFPWFWKKTVVEETKKDSQTSTYKKTSNKEK